MVGGEEIQNNDKQTKTRRVSCDTRRGSSHVFRPDHYIFLTSMDARPHKAHRPSKTDKKEKGKEKQHGFNEKVVANSDA